METTNRFFSGLAATRGRLALLAATFVAATVGWSAPATAAVTALTMQPQVGVLNSGTAGSATYELTLTRNSSYPSDSSIVRWTVAPGGLPAGATASFAAVGAWSGATRAYRLTISTTTATLAGTTNLTVTATPSLTGQGTASASRPLVVSPPVQVAQTITFGPIADRAVGDAPFNVSATASSGLAVTLVTAPAGVCSNSGNAITVIGVGTCTVTATQGGNANFQAAPTVQRSFAVAPASTDTPTFSLYASSGSVMLASSSVNIWGYRTSAGAATGPGGPTIIVNEGDTVTVKLFNQLSVTTGLLFQGQDMVPDTTGAAPGSTKTYTFVASRPGTYLYEAGLLHNAEHQVAMGLHGALVVRPLNLPGQAYADSGTAFDVEHVMLLSEIDPALNNSADPAAFDMRIFAPRYFLINGQVYPSTAPVAAVPGNKVLLRYVNAGAQHHSMGLLGLRQKFVAKDGNPLKTGSQSVTAETLAAGQTGDAIAEVSATTPAGSRFAVYDASMKLHNAGNGNTFGGMLTFVEVAGTAGTGDTLGPIATTASVNLFGILNVSMSDVGRGSVAGANVTAAEYFLDTTTANGSGGVMTATTPLGPTRSFASAAGLTGNHTVFVHGRDAAGNWGPYKVVVISSDTTGPTTSALVLSPNPATGLGDVTLTGTANDTASGGSNIAAAEYTIDGGTPVAMTVGTVDLPPAKIAALAATIPVATINALTNGQHTVAVRSRDTAPTANWGNPVTITLLVNKTVGPVTSAVSATPNPNNGTTPLSATQAVVRVTATVSCVDCLSVGGAEGFIDVAGAEGSGFPFIPVDGAWGSSVETVFADIPLATVAGLSSGNHPIIVRGMEAVGVWGAAGQTILVVDKIAPTISSTTLAPNAIALGAASVTLNVSANEALAGGQYWIDGTATPPATPTAFNGSSAVINTAALTGGTHTVFVRVQDTASNFSAVTSATLTVVQAVADTKSFNAPTGTGTQTQIFNSANASLLANDLPTNATVELVSAPVRTGGTGTVTPTLSCPTGAGNTATAPVGASTVCTNGRFNVNMATPVGSNSNATRAAGRRGTYTFTYRITSGGATSAPVTVTLNVN